MFALPLILFGISMISYYRFRNSKYLYIALAFFLFFVQGLMELADMMMARRQGLRLSPTVAPEILLNTLILLIFSFVIFRRSTTTIQYDSESLPSEESSEPSGPPPGDSGG